METYTQLISMQQVLLRETKQKLLSTLSSMEQEMKRLVRLQEELEGREENSKQTSSAIPQHSTTSESGWKLRQVKDTLWELTEEELLSVPAIVRLIRSCKAPGQ